MLAIVTHTRLTPQITAELTKIYPQIFESFNAAKFFRKFDYHFDFLILMAYWDGEIAGFKIGYGQDPDLFYSWTGGVLPSYRRKNIARELMHNQHNWCRQKGYKRIETRTRNKFPAMLKLNIDSGFQIVGSFTDTDQTPKIILRKELHS